MTFEQLEYFLAAARAETFFDAAESLHITQSALSKQIMKLEKELNVRLFDRSRRSAVLTDAGREFLKEAGDLFHRYRAMRKRMQAFEDVSERTLRIGTLPFLSQYGLTGLFKDFSAAHPEIRLLLEEVEEIDLLSGFSSGRYDLIIARSHMCDESHFRFLLLDEDRLAAMLPAGHPLAWRKSVSLSDLAGEPFLLMHPYTSLYQLCMKLFHDAGITPHVLRTARLESIISAVALGEGVSLFAEKNFNLFRHESVVSVPIVPSPTLSVGVIYKDGEVSAEGERFLESLKKD
jgi:DNA-binding transcriptional LysR family regulator